MHGMDFPGLDELVRVVDAAAAQEGEEPRVHGVKEGLEGLIRRGALELPEPACRPLTEGYARRLLYRSELHGYTVIAMTWGPGQGTPLHDHAGIWCVEGVWRGCLEVVRYALVERAEERYRFRRQESLTAGVGSAGSLIPPYEYHTLANTLPDAASVTIHVYGGEMETCSIFEPCGDGWCLRRERVLRYHH